MITITAKDASNVTVTDYTGDVMFKVIPETGAVVLASNNIHNFTGSENGVSSFTGVDFRWAGRYKVKVEDLLNDTITGESLTLTVNHTNELPALSVSHILPSNGWDTTLFHWTTPVDGVFYSRWDPVKQEFWFPRYYNNGSSITGFLYYFHGYGEQIMKIVPVSGNYQAGPETIYTFTWIEETATGTWEAGNVKLDFPESLMWNFYGYSDHQSFLHFNYDGNGFEGILFPWSYTLSTGVDISLGGTTIEDCKKQVRGLYYSNPRWYRIRPLDQNSLEKLTYTNTSYANLSLEWGFFFDCSGVNENNIYGQIKHNLDGNDYYLIAGVDYDTSDNSYNATFSGTTIMSGLDMVGKIFDDKAGIALLEAVDYVALQWAIAPVLWTHLQQIGGAYYSDQALVSLQVSANKTANYTIHWDISPNVNGTTPDTLMASLTTNDGAKTIQALFSAGSATDTASLIINLDTAAPSAVTLISPSSGSTVSNYTGSIVLSRTGGDDTGIGTNNYFYNIMNSSWATVASWSTANKTNIISISTGTASYHWYVSISDLFWHTTKSLTGYFSVTSWALDISPDNFSLDTRHNAKPSTTYQSNIIIVKWLGSWVNVEASVNAGILFINGIFSSTTGQVRNGDVVWIERISNRYYADNSHYDDHKNTTGYDSHGNPESILTIWDKSSSFIIKNMDEDEDSWDASQYENALTNSLRWTIREAFQDLTKTYEDKSISRQRDVFLALKDIIKWKMLDVKLKIKTSSNKSLEQKYKKQLTILAYLYEYTLDHLTENLGLDTHLLDSSLDKNNIYETPNGNEYEIKYDEEKWYYSDDMRKIKHFATLAQIKAYLDINNPDPEADISKRIIAPNKKRYNIIQNQKWQYGSLYFKTPVWFTTLNEMIRYVSINNPYDGNDCDRKDSSIDIIPHTTPNGKYYSIAKSREWKYYSPDTSANLCYEYLNDLVAVLNAFNE